MARGSLHALLESICIAIVFGRPVVRAAFLQEALPLEVVVTTPSALMSNQTQEISVSERAPLTVVFSRPVIALGSDFGQAGPPAATLPFTLGCNVPGLSRWVTTTIFRFDPLIDWPTDLACAFKWNAGLKTFDGAPLLLGDAAPQTLATMPMMWEVLAVSSERADNLTDNQWSAYRGMAGDNFPEVPPDANVTLGFSYPVVLSALQSSLRLASCCKRDDAKGRSVRVLPCGPPLRFPDPFSPAARDPMAQNSTCAVVQVVPGLKAGEVVVLTLPAGAAYNPVAGRPKRALEAYLWGLRRFRIPLRDNFKQLTGASEPFDDSDDGISYRRMTAWLPHGLDPAVKVSALAAQITLCRYADPYKWSSNCQNVKFELSRVDGGTLLMAVPSFEPRQHYHLKVKASPAIKDGFGLPLEASEAFFFTTEPHSEMSSPALAGGGSLMVLEPDTKALPLRWPIASRGKPQSDSDPAGAIAWSIEPRAYPDAMKLTSAYDFNLAPTKLGTARSSFQRYQGALPKIEALTLSGEPSLQLVANTLARSKGINNAMYVAQTALQYAGVMLGTRMTAWVTDTRGTPPPPVVGAEVSLYFSTYSEGVARGPSCKTAGDGTCSIELKSLLAGRYGTLAALVTAPGHGPLLVNSIDTPYVPSPSDAGSYGSEVWAGVLVLDRALVKPGDTLHVTGYLQSRNGTRLSVPPPGITAANLSVTPNFDSTNYDAMKFPVAIDPRYGSLHANIAVPAGAQLVQYEVALLLPRSADGGGSGDAVSITTEDFTVADPRPPTAVLNLTVPNWALPDATVKALLKVTSYLGADVSDAVIAVTWTVPLATGSLNVTTDARGRAIVRIPLGELPAANATKLGDQLEIRAKWVGPTGEPYSESRNVKIAEGPVRAVVRRSPLTEVPGVPFIVAATTYVNDASDTPLEGVTVEVSLAPANKTSVENCSASERAALAKQRCTAVSGQPPVGADGQACTMALPCAANLLIRACALSFANGTKIRGGLGGRPPCSESPVGRNATAWARGPWSFQPRLQIIRDRANYTLGSTATLSFSVPAYAGPTSGFVIWGNKDARRTRALPRVAPGPGTVAIGPLGDECRGSCRAALVLSAGRPADTKSVAGKLPKVPTSKIFDPLSPYTLSDTVDLPIVGDSRLDVSVAVEGAGGLRTREGNASVAAPLGTATVTVDVRGSSGGPATAGAQVTVVVVDQSILDLMPYDLKDVAASIQPAPDSYLQVRELNANRITRKAINATFAVLARRLGLDPWLPFDTTVSPSSTFDSGSWGYAASYPTTNPVDVPDALYLKRFSTPVTVTPFYSWGSTQRYPAAARGKADASAALRLSDQFQTVPLFRTVETDANGRAVVEFEAPANLGAFSVRAYAVSRGIKGRPSKYGGNETKLVVRLPVSLTPALPRIVRVGDTFDSGVLVSAPDAGAEPLTITVQATVTPPASGAAADSAAAEGGGLRRRALLAARQGTNVTARQTEVRSVVLLPSDPYTRAASLSAARQQVEVRFRFKATAVGAAGLRFDVFVRGSDAASDSASYDVPVLGRQAPVFLATSFALQPGAGVFGSGSRGEGLALPEADPGSGSVDLVAGVGSLPYLQAAYGSLVSRVCADPAPEPFAPDTIAVAALPALLARYGPGSATPEQLNCSRLAATQASGDLTDSGGVGLMFFAPLKGAYGSSLKPSRASVSLNAWAAWLVAQAAQAAGSEKSLSYLGGLAAKAGGWRDALARQVINDAEEARKQPAEWYDAFGTPRPKGAAAPPVPRYRDWTDLSWLRLALGASWAPNTSDSGVAEDLAFGRLVAAAKVPGNTTVGTAARTGLALLSEARSAGAGDAAAIAKALQGQTRVQGRTAYIAIAPGSPYSAWAEDQAWALALMARALPKAGAQAALVQKVAAGVARGPRQTGVGPICVSTGGTTAGVASAALSWYDESRGSTQPAARVLVEASNAAGVEKTLLDASFTAKDGGKTQSSSTPWGALPLNATALSVSATGRGEVSVAAGLTFTPARLLAFPTYRGLWVERVIQAEAGEGSLAAAAAGQVVTVTVQTTTPDDLGQVVVEVLMPGGLEPIDPAVYKDPSAQLQCGLGDAGGGGGFRSWWWCPQTQVVPAVVRVSYYSLPAGTATVSFKATAATPGTFALPPVKAYAVGQPEVSGLSAAGTFVVCPAAGRPPSAAPLVRDPGFGPDDDDAKYAAAGAGGGAAAADPAVPGPAPDVCSGGKAALKPPAEPAKACPRNCGGNGVCNLASGACICNQGFAGADCSKAAATRRLRLRR